MHQRGFIVPQSPLKYGLHKYTDTDQTLQCLVLTLTIFGNLSVLQNDMKIYEEKLFTMFSDFVSKAKKLIKKFLNMLKTFYRYSLKIKVVSSISLVVYLNLLNKASKCPRRTVVCQTSASITI